MTTATQDNYASGIGEVLSLAVLVNNKTDFCAFANFYGNVDAFELQIALEKKNWQKKAISVDLGTKFGTNGYSGIDPDKLEKAKNLLQHMLDQNEIPFDAMQAIPKAQIDWEYTV